MTITSKPPWGTQVAGEGGELAVLFQAFFDDLEEQLNTRLLGPQLQLPSYTVLTLPSPATAGGMIYVTDETGGAVPAFSDGTDWLRVTDRAIVS